MPNGRWRCARPSAPTSRCWPTPTAVTRSMTCAPWCRCSRTRGWAGWKSRSRRMRTGPGAPRRRSRPPFLPLAAGENCHTRYDFQRLVDAGNVSILQPDLSRCGGVTEAVRIAALASAAGLPVCTHGCHTGLNMAASVHFLAGIDNARYFEGDGSTDNPLRTAACSASYELSSGRDGHPAGGARDRRGRGRGLHPRPPDHRRPRLALTLGARPPRRRTVRPTARPARRRAPGPRRTRRKGRRARAAGAADAAGPAAGTRRRAARSRRTPA